jgi:hypothetical protein
MIKKTNFFNGGVNDLLKISQRVKGVSITYVPKKKNFPDFQTLFARLLQVWGPVIVET